MRKPLSWRHLLACSTLAFATIGCQKHETASAAGTASATAAAPAGAGACRLLRANEIEAVLAGAKQGEPDESRKQYGISACTWATSRGTLILQFWDSEGSSAKDEAKSLVLGVVDPLKGAARNNVRLEDIAGLGEEAVAVVETKDEARGVLTDTAMIIVQRNNRILMLAANELARSERSKALAGLKALGKSAAERL
jgi:hypothetical protein